MIVRNPSWSKISEGLIFFSILLLSVAFSFLAALLFFYLSYPVHEYGHIFWGTLGSYIVYHEPAIIEISNTVPFPMFPMIEMPQSVHIVQGKATIFLVFGGPITSILFSFVVSSFFYNFFKIPKLGHLIFLYPILMVWQELYGNVLCGTDHLGEAITCDGIVHQAFLYIPYLLLIPFMPYFYYFLLNLAAQIPQMRRS